MNLQEIMSDSLIINIRDVIVGYVLNKNNDLSSSTFIYYPIYNPILYKNGSLDMKTLNTQMDRLNRLFEERIYRKNGIYFNIVKLKASTGPFSFGIKDDSVKITYQISSVENYQSYLIGLLPELQVKIFSYLTEKEISILLRDDEFPQKIDGVDIYALIFSDKFPKFKDLYSLYSKGKYVFT